MELCAGVPANWMVLVVGVIVDWASAEKVANARKTTRQNKPAAEFPRNPDLLCGSDAVLIEGLTLAFPSREPWLPRSFAGDFKEGIIQTARHNLHPEAPQNLLTTALHLRPQAHSCFFQNRGCS
jgi:hypothetical protein